MRLGPQGRAMHELLASTGRAATGHSAVRRMSDRTTAAAHLPELARPLVRDNADTAAHCCCPFLTSGTPMLLDLVWNSSAGERRDIADML